MLPQNKKLKPFATDLRNNATRQENHLWYDFLRTYPVQFNRQKIIMNYIADFYCYQARLVIELDGSQHYTKEGMAYDVARTEILNALDLEVLRFSNAEIDKEFRHVCEKIDQVVRSRAITRPCGPPSL